MSVIDQTDLWYCEGTSDKVYHATIEKSGSGYVVNFAYGRRGSALKTGSKTTGPVPLPQAQKIYERLVSEKTGKGYQLTTSTASSKAIPVVQPSSNTSQNKPEVQCVLLNPIEGYDVDNCLNSDDWYAQPKLDGVRFLLKKQGPHIVGYNRKGIQIAAPIEIVLSVQTSDAYYEGGCANFLVDGELIGNVYYVFDILEYNDKDIRSMSVENRMDTLRDFFPDIESENLQFVDIVKGTKNKKNLYDQLQQNNKEGIVFKNRLATYVAGRPNSGGLYLKNKFYSTASCFVSEINAKRSIKLSVLDENSKYWINVGNCTIPVNHDIPSPGDIVEIKYLYAYKNGSLYQPIYLGVRSDLDQNDAIYKQIKFKSEND